jgi:hypothetical protein
MVEPVVELVEGLAVRISLIQRIGLLISPIELRRKAAKQFCHRQICLPIPVVGGRIENHWGSIGQGPVVAAPQISMQQSGFWPVVLKKGFQLRHYPFGLGHPRAAIPLLASQFHLVEQPLFPIKIRPILPPTVDLRRGADGVVPLPAVAAVGG